MWAGPKEAEPRPPHGVALLPLFPLDSRVRGDEYFTSTTATPEGRRCTTPAAPRGVAGRPNPGSVRRRRKAIPITFPNGAEPVYPSPISIKSWPMIRRPGKFA